MNVNIWKSYVCTEVEETDIEAILAVMNTTELVVKTNISTFQYCFKSSLTLISLWKVVSYKLKWQVAHVTSPTKMAK